MNVDLGTTQKPVSLDLEMPGAVFAGGSTIEAAVRVTARRDVVLDGGDVELIRAVTYRYRAWGAYGGSSTATARESQVVAQETLHLDGSLSAGQSTVRQVALAVPGGALGSAVTELVEVEWHVHANVRAKQLHPTDVTKKIVVLSGAPDRAQVAEVREDVADRGFAALNFASLNTRRLTPGATLSGVLAVAPVHAASARGIRVDLVLAQHVVGAPDTPDDPGLGQFKDAETVVASLQLAQHVNLDPARPLEFPFSLVAPPEHASKGGAAQQVCQPHSGPAREPG